MSKLQPFDIQLLNELIQIIEQGKRQAAMQVNSTLNIVFWQVGKRINRHILNEERAEYGKRIVLNLSDELRNRFGHNFDERNLRRMIRFAETFPDFQIVTTLSIHLTWSHFITLLPIKDETARLFYAQKIADEMWSVRHTRKQIEQKVYERTQLAGLQIAPTEPEQNTIFKDPYFLDFLGLKDGYLENDLEAAILKELELFLLELGTGFTFVERQKRMIIDDDDHRLDLLFYHRKLRRLLAIDLKIGKFKAAYKGQMELYLKWLNRHDKQENEESPIGLILCTEAGREQIELLEMHKDGIMVAEYWTELPPKAVLEQKLHDALREAQERLERRRLE